MSLRPLAPGEASMAAVIQDDRKVAAFAYNRAMVLIKNSLGRDREIESLVIMRVDLYPQTLALALIVLLPTTHGLRTAHTQRTYHAKRVLLPLELHLPSYTYQDSHLHPAPSLRILILITPLPSITSSHVPRGAI
jgi:hypothetical protein